jgi:hypothetical protein
LTAFHGGGGSATFAVAAGIGALTTAGGARISATGTVCSGCLRDAAPGTPTLAATAEGERVGLAMTVGERAGSAMTVVGERAGSAAGVATAAAAAVVGGTALAGAGFSQLVAPVRVFHQ